MATIVEYLGGLALSDTPRAAAAGAVWPAVLDGFRSDYYGCLTARADALFELTDAVLCADGPVTSLVGLSLAAEHRRGHGALYDALNSGGVDIARLRVRLAGLPLPKRTDGRIVLAVDVSNWLRPDASTSADRLFCHVYGRGRGQAQMIPGWPYSFVAVLESGRTSWTQVLDAVRLGPADDATAVTAAQLRNVVGRLIAAGHWRDGDPNILIVADAGYDITRLAFVLAACPCSCWVECLGQQARGVAEGAAADPDRGGHPRGCRLALAWRVFGRDRVNGEIRRIRAVLAEWGYQLGRDDDKLLPMVACRLFLLNRSPHVDELSTDLFDRIRRQRLLTGTRLNTLLAMQRAVAQLGNCDPPTLRTGRHALRASGSPQTWARWVERWHTTSMLTPRVRGSVRGILLKVGRWLAAEHPEEANPSAWTRQTCAAWVAALDRMNVGDYAQRTAGMGDRVGKPLEPASKATQLGAVRTFFRDCQEWEWLPRRFDPQRALATPRSVAALLGPDPRVNRRRRVGETALGRAQPGHRRPSRNTIRQLLPP